MYGELVDSDDTYISSLGCKLIEVLEFSDMLKKLLVRTEQKKQHQELVISDEDLMSKVGNHRIYTVPTKLPMIVKPKPYSTINDGGYLLNDLYYHENLIIDNKKFKYTSLYSEDICYMINKISCTTFKINTSLLDFIIDPINDKYNLLMDSTHIHKYANIKRTRSQDRVYKSHNSKVTLQETILEITNFYRNFNEIYFPVRLDQRGRLYCSPGFFNYQSNELSKSLLLFAKPGIIHKTNYESIMYLKAYGANCFGGGISKLSIQSKQKWVDDRIDNIINYENGILLSKATDKLLFLAFCMEFKRFYNFY